MKEQKVSVVMPSYNGEKYIYQAIKSIIKQSYENWELVIVDDCSSDTTVDIIRSFCDPKIRFFKNDKNMGISYSTNRAISESTGSFIALLDDDDMATEERIELQVQYLNKHPEIDVLGGSHIVIDKNSNCIRAGKDPIYNPKIIKAYMHFINRRFSNGTTMIRKAFIDRHNLKFEENCYGMQDFKFIIECSKLGNISSIGQVLQLKRIHDNEETVRQINMHKKERMEKYADFQRQSILKSGYKLSDEQLYAINSCITETIRTDINDKELRNLWSAMKELITQAYARHLDYAPEMEFVCKTVFCERGLCRNSYNLFDAFFS